MLWCKLGWILLVDLLNEECHLSALGAEAAGLVMAAL